MGEYCRGNESVANSEIYFCLFGALFYISSVTDTDGFFFLF